MCFECHSQFLLFGYYTWHAVRQHCAVHCIYTHFTGQMTLNQHWGNLLHVLPKTIWIIKLTGQREECRTPLGARMYCLSSSVALRMIKNSSLANVNYLPSHRASQCFDQYQFILPGDSRHMWSLWTTCPRLLPDSGAAELNLQPLSCKSSALTITPPGHPVDRIANHIRDTHRHS